MAEFPPLVFWSLDSIRRSFNDFMEDSSKRKAYSERLLAHGKTLILQAVNEGQNEASKV